MRHFILGGLALSTLAGCGGGGGTSAELMEPLAASGYAQPGDTIAPGDSFSIPNVSRMIITGSSNSLANQDVEVEILTSQDALRVTVGGDTLTLPYDAANDYYEATGGSVEGLFFVDLIEADYLDQVFVSTYNPATDTFNGGYLHLGFDTDPDTIAALSGTAVYSGDATADIYSGPLFALAYGTGSVTADFGANEVSGVIDISDSGASFNEFTVPNITVTVLDGDISGNGFSGGMTLSPVAGLSVDSASYKGRFFGSNAESVGATFGVTGSTPDGDLVIQGGFAGTDPAR